MNNKNQKNNTKIEEQYYKYSNSFENHSHLGFSSGSRRKLYEIIAKRFSIKSALYPGSYIDITPSFFIPKVVYIDDFKPTNKFFKQENIVLKIINDNKCYDAEPQISFFQEDYYHYTSNQKFDLIISQFAGFVAKTTKKFLKTNGFALCNDSHLDATLLFHDPDFKLFAIINKNNEIKKTNLEQCFCLPKNKKQDLEYLNSLIESRGAKKYTQPKYLVNAPNYLFQKIN